jgi:translation initiation factor eIF-2B subunit delta
LARRRHHSDEMLPRAIQVQIAELAADHTSGAVDIATKAAGVLALFAEEGEAEDEQSFRRGLVATGKALIQAQPSMAPLFNLVNTLVAAVQGARDLGTARKLVRREAEVFRAELGRRSEKIAQQALSVLPEGCTVLTHSRSSTVLAALQLAMARGRLAEVVCTECRPGYEGRATAATLAQGGVRTTLVTDSAAASLLGRANLVLVGADSISRDGLVNKMGTYAVALAAKDLGVPFYALCGTEKLLPTDYPYFRIAPQDPEEVWPEHPEGVQVLNLYFDVTPLKYVSGVVTERGVLASGGLEDELGRLKMQEQLLDH